MNTIKVNTAELEGAALDWAVAEALGLEEFEGRFGSYWIARNGEEYGKDGYWQPSTDWSQGGPLIEKYGIGVAKFFEPIDGPVMVGMEWAALWVDDSVRMDGHAALVAACRAIVAAKLGAVVQVPADLIGGAA